MDRDAAIDAEGALGWFGWDGEGPLRLRRYDLQLYLWYQLPTKYLAPLDAKRAAAAALGRLLALLGVPYAALCDAPETGRMLELWERDDPAAPRELHKLLEASGLEPPDTAQLTWGSVMGLEEAQVRDDVASALEVALEDGALRPGTPGFRRRQEAVVAAALAADGRLDSIHAERLQRWRSRRPILERVADEIAAPAPPVDDDAAASALAPAIWLLERAGDGLALTQTGALSRALVREAVERWPDWWDAELFGPPNQEAEILPLLHLHHLLRRMRLLRRTGRRVVATSRAGKLTPAALLEACATALLAGDTFDASVGELTAALLLAGEPVEIERLAEQIHPVILAEGWHAGAARPSIHQTGAAIGQALARAEPLGIVTGQRWKDRRLTEVGRSALHTGLRARALGPATTI
ncbi:hypothetical protein [Candidatus Solirubrobacter pratensis]|uniref:hypothetical protein n=1 Tax=Candidatus Solirubrobacter pratensis TaxID=1298857 RepID=UPI00048A1ABA|nr:hypothetical protein [Candidatus Solirubrobacter pratensis]